MAENTHETKIVIGGSDSGAIGLLQSVRKNLDGVFQAVGNVTKYLSRLNWAINAVQTVIAGIKKFHEWMNRAATAAKALREELAKTKYDTQVAHAAASYEKLVKSLAEANRLEKERNDILAQRKAYERDIEDANVERDKQMEISRLDPNAKDYADRKKEIERKYELAASDAKAARASGATRSQNRSYDNRDGATASSRFDVRLSNPLSDHPMQNPATRALKISKKLPVKFQSSLITLIPVF